MICHLRYIFFVFELNKEKKDPDLIIALMVFPEITLYPSIKSTIILLEINFYVFYFHRLINNLCKITVTTVGLDYSFFLCRTGTSNHLIWFKKYSTLMDKHNISTLMDKHNISTLMDKHNISTLMDKHNVSTELQV